MDIEVRVIERANSSASMAGDVDIELYITMNEVRTPADIDRAIQSLQRQRMVLVAIQEGYSEPLQS